MRGLSDNPFGNDGDKWHTCFFRDVENEYVWLRSDSVLVFINPTKGNTIRTLQLDVAVEGGIYDRKNNRLIGISSVSTARLCCLQ